MQQAGSPQRASRAGAAGSPPLSGWRVTAVRSTLVPTWSHCARATTCARPLPPPRTCACARLTFRPRARALENSTPELAPPCAPFLLPSALRLNRHPSGLCADKMAAPIPRGLFCLSRALGWWSRQVGRDQANEILETEGGGQSRRE